MALIFDWIFVNMDFVPVFAIYQTIFSLCSYHHIRIRQNCSGNNCIIIY